MKVEKKDYKAPSLEDRISYEEMILKYLLEYGINVKDRTITITGEINDDTFTQVDFGLSYLESLSKKSITIKLKSCGGYVYSGLAIIGRMKESDCTIKTRGYGAVMSIATLILAAGTEGKRSLSKYARFMWHELSYGTDHERHVNQKHSVLVAEDEWKLMCKHMSEFSKKPIDFWETSGSVFDKYFSPEELLKLGVIEEVF